ncbi:YbdK family carboxylate-amine ligase [Thermoleophilia bacterium SCSIO 60948]|nr:YbdK family carboxylate-amine ligase [Thermoleophilia bacterium SCSIO 60948]
MSDLPSWARWRAAPGAQPYTLGVEEEVMLVDPADWALAHSSGAILGELGPDLQGRIIGETHASALELATGVHDTAYGAFVELRELRTLLLAELEADGLCAAGAGTHPLATWHDTVITEQPRYRAVHDSMRELARREPTFATHVHVGVPDAEDAIRLANQFRAHLPLLLALSANSPFWQGRDSGLSSSRTPLFQAFPRVGIPSRFDGYAGYVAAVGPLIQSGVIPDTTFLWWDVRVQPRLGTVEVRIMDSQAHAAESAAIAALIQATAALELELGFAEPDLVAATEVLVENRFLATRDGMAARFAIPGTSRPVPAFEILERLLDAAAPFAERLGSTEFMDKVLQLATYSGSSRQRDAAVSGGPRGAVRALADSFASAPIDSPPTGAELLALPPESG